MITFKPILKQQSLFTIIFISVLCVVHDIDYVLLIQRFYYDLPPGNILQLIMRSRDFISTIVIK